MELLYCGQERWLCLKGNVSSVSDTRLSAKFTLSSKRPAQYSITQRINELYSAELKYGNNCWSAEAGTAWLSGDEFSVTTQTPWEGEGRTFLFSAFLWKNWVGMKWTNFLGIILSSNVSSARNDHQADKTYTPFTPAKHVLLNWFSLNENYKQRTEKLDFPLDSSTS